MSNRNTDELLYGKNVEKAVPKPDENHYQSALMKTSRTDQPAEGVSPSTTQGAAANTAQSANVSASTAAQNTAQTTPQTAAGSASVSNTDQVQAAVQTELPSYDAARTNYNFADAYNVPGYLNSGVYLPPEYQGSEYDSRLKNAVDYRQGYSYGDFLGSENYGDLRDSYIREGQRAMQNTLGQLAARTGGMASSYAASAASQSYNDYMSRLSDAARQMFQSERDDLDETIYLLRQLSQDDRTAYEQSLSDFKDAWNTNYSLNANRAEALAGAGDYSGYGDIGYSLEEVGIMQDYYDKQQAKEEENIANDKIMEIINMKVKMELPLNEQELRALGMDDEYIAYYLEKQREAYKGTSLPVTEPVELMIKDEDVQIAKEAFEQGDHSEDIVVALLTGGYSRQEILDMGYSGDYFREYYDYDYEKTFGSGKIANSLSTQVSKTSGGRRIYYGFIPEGGIEKIKDVEMAEVATDALLLGAKYLDMGYKYEAIGCIDELVESNLISFAYAENIKRVLGLK